MSSAVKGKPVQIIIYAFSCFAVRMFPSGSHNQMAATIAKNVKQARIEKGLTQSELADLVGITREAIAAYETGRVRLMDDILIRFADILKVTTDEILGIKKARTNKSDLSLRLVKRLQKIENLPPNQQKVLLKNIDMFLKAAESED